MHPQLIFIAVLGAALLGSAASISFSYDDQDAWTNLNGSFCGGTSQSPIDILTSDVSTDRVLPALQFSGGWSASRNGETFNTGHSAEFTPEAEDATTTFPLGPGKTCAVLQFHLHWGSSAGQGSEHTVGGAQYSGELHFVHSCPEASEDPSDPNVFAVVGVFLEEDGEVAIAGSPWENFKVPKNLSTVIDATGIVYSDFLPESSDYYHYNGSLTTPLCNEAVNWFVMQNAIKVPSAFLAMLRMMQEDGGGVINHNFREVQDLNGRQILLGGSKAVSGLSVLCLLFLSYFAAIV